MNEVKKIFRRRFITIRVSAKEKEDILKMANRENKEVSAYIRGKLGLKEESKNGK